MATTQSHFSFDVNINAYEYEGEQLDMLLMSVEYSKGDGFYVTYHPAKRTSCGYSCNMSGAMYGDSPLKSIQRVLIKQSTRNNVKELQRMFQNLQDFKDGIRFLFDHRVWDKLNKALKNVAVHGYTGIFRVQMQAFMKQLETETTTTPDTTSETVKDSSIMKQFRTLKAKYPHATFLFDCGDYYEAYEDDAKAVSEVLSIKMTSRDGVDIAGFPHHDLDTNLPKLIRAGVRVAVCNPLELPEKKEQPKPIEQPETTTPKQENNMATTTINQETNNVPTAQIDSNEQIISMGLSEVSFATYTTKKGGTAPQIIGFSGEDDPRWKAIHDNKPKWASACWVKDISGNRVYRLIFGTRYMDAAKALCEAYNTNDRTAWNTAEQGCADCYEKAVADGKAAREAAKAERKARREATTTAPPTITDATVKTYTEAEVAALMQRVLKGDAEALTKVNAMMGKAA